MASSAAKTTVLKFSVCTSWGYAAEAQDLARQIEARRPDIRCVIETHSKPGVARAQLALRFAMLAVVAVILAGYAGLSLPGALKQLNWTLVLGGLFVGHTICNVASATGAFEVVNMSNGMLLHSKLATGEVPTVDQILNFNAPGTAAAGAKGTGAVSAAATTPAAE